MDTNVLDRYVSTYSGSTGTGLLHGRRGYSAMGFRGNPGLLYWGGAANWCGRVVITVVVGSDWGDDQGTLLLEGCDTTHDGGRWMKSAEYPDITGDVTDAIVATLVAAYRKFLQEQGSLQSPLDAQQASSIRTAMADIRTATGLPMDRIAVLFGVSRTCAYHWLNTGRITDEHRRQLLAVHDVIRRARQYRGSADEVAAWLERPVGIDGRTPERMLIEGEFDRARLLAVTYLSPSIAPPPAWTATAAAATPRLWAESAQEPIPLAEDDLPAYPDDEDNE